ncbi:MAG TPA: acetamidase/formamidase family protein [Bryobacteraceae bacterium]|nr:acetamidase/formamidase family protein [Bryobacteraceae bacterium]
MVIRLVAFFLFVFSLSAADLAGPWEVFVSGGQLTEARRVQITSDNGRYKWKFLGFEFLGAPQGDNVEFQCRQDDKPCGLMKGKISSTGMQGDGTLQGIVFKWSARRPLVRPASAPTHHEFTPTIFYREFSGMKEPVLHLFPGDTVHTETVDAGGTDSHGVHRVIGGNPLTGPFYIEGAMPGDALVVKLTRVRLNRDSAESGDQVIANALDPYYFRDQPKVDHFNSEWDLDRGTGTAMLKSPTERLKHYTIPLHPMIGCIGVAPSANQSFRAGYLGNWGGNMDYNQIVEGTTVYLPVNVPGALLYIGDGHAAQGDGELAGDALETSMDIEFTVNVEQDAHLQGPHFENDQYVMVSGIGNSLQEALQHATTGLSQYLEKRYKLNPAEIGVVLDSAIKYDIAEVVDPEVHIVAKLPRSVLVMLTPK